MNYRTYEKRLNYILELIEKNRLRSAETLAKSFGCSSRTIKRMFAHLRENGHNVRYNPREKKYFIKKEE